MIFEESKTIEKVGEKFGYVFSYFIFTTILFLILLVLKKISDSWTYFHIMGIVLFVVLASVFLKWSMK